MHVLATGDRRGRATLCIVLCDMILILWAGVGAKWFEWECALEAPVVEHLAPGQRRCWRFRR